jgi:hypothetical protein
MSLHDSTGQLFDGHATYFFLIFRLYGPEKALFDKSWKLQDVEKVQ